MDLLVSGACGRYLGRKRPRSPIHTLYKEGAIDVYPWCSLSIHTLFSASVAQDWKRFWIRWLRIRWIKRIIWDQWIPRCLSLTTKYFGGNFQQVGEVHHLGQQGGVPWLRWMRWKTCAQLACWSVAGFNYGSRKSSLVLTRLSHNGLADGTGGGYGRIAVCTWW